MLLNWMFAGFARKTGRFIRRLKVPTVTHVPLLKKQDKVYLPDFLQRSGTYQIYSTSSLPDSPHRCLGSFGAKLKDRDPGSVSGFGFRKVSETRHRACLTWWRGGHGQAPREWFSARGRGGDAPLSHGSAECSSAGPLRRHTGHLLQCGDV